MRTVFTALLLMIVSKLTIAQNDMDKKLVRQAILAFQEDFNNGYFNNSTNYATDSWVHINPGGGIKKGRQEVLKEVREVHQTFLKGVSMTIESLHIEFLSATVAVVDVVHVISPYELPAGVRHVDERNIKLYVVVKANKKWLITYDQNTVVQGSNSAAK